jgi:hypothetical protein
MRDLWRKNQYSTIRACKNGIKECFQLDQKTIKHHFIQQILQHEHGIDEETLVQKTAESAGVDTHEHQENILAWIEYLVKTGHLKRSEHGITAEEASRLAFIHMVDERRRDLEGVAAMPQLWEFFRE